MRIDQNNKYATLAYDGTNTVPLKCDPITGRLLIDITVVAESTSVLNASKIDENTNNSSLVFDGTNIRPILADNRNGLIYCDILIE